MTRLLHALTALASLALTTSAQQSQSDDTPSFEVDIIFPRNETYKETEHLPIAFVFQNVSAVLAAPKIMGKPTIQWSIMPFRGGWSPGGLHLDEGEFTIPTDATKQDHTIFVAYTNITAWWDDFRKPPAEEQYRYQLRWHVRWLAHQGNGGECDHVAQGKMMFNLERLLWYEDPKMVGKTADIMQATECPAFAGSVQIRPNATMPDCPIIDDKEKIPVVEGMGNPCAVKVDKALLSSISSEASRLAIPPATSSEVTTSTSTDGARVLRPIQTVLAAACVLCGLAL